MAVSRLYFIPAMMGITMMLAIVLSYIVAVLRDDVDALFPYISDTGNEVPESNIFAQFLNMAAFLGMITVYLHYRLVRELTCDQSTTIRRLANFGLVCSLLASFGLSLVGNFQSKKIPAVHFTGAAMVFGLGVLYEFIDTAVTKLMYPQYCGLYILKVRTSICVVSFISLVLTGVGGAISRWQWYQYASPKADQLHWNKTDPGYSWHITSTVGEWATGLTFILYFFTFIREFRKFDVDLLLKLKVQHLDQDEDSCLVTDVHGGEQTGHSYGSVASSANQEPDEHTRLVL